jgi:hypothetical protein
MSQRSQKLAFLDSTLVGMAQNKYVQLNIGEAA